MLTASGARNAIPSAAEKASGVKATYLCGGINGLSDAECRDWRDVAKTLLRTGTIDPMRHDYRGREDECWKEIVQADVRDIETCDYLLVNATRPSWGTAMEVIVAFFHGKHAVAFTNGATVSPWLRYHCAELHDSLEDAVSAINARATT